MGVATYKTSKHKPAQMKGILPDTDQLRKLLNRQFTAFKEKSVIPVAQITLFWVGCCN